MDLNELKKEVLSCKKCDLYDHKKNYVFGEGNPVADIVFIGEAPGGKEDKLGRPFVGPSGKTFDGLLKSIELNRESVYISNILKCRPPNNRDPLPHEIDACAYYLKTQLELLKPKFICPLGSYASKFIFEKYGLKDEFTRISDVHGKIYSITNLFEKIKIMPLYHPAVAVYNPDMKQNLIEDFGKLKEVLK